MIDERNITITVPVASVEQWSSMEHFVIHFCCTLDGLTDLLSYTPHITHLSCLNIVESNEILKTEVLMKLTNLVHLITLKIYRNCDKNRIRLLSLGTGDYVPNPLDPDSSRNLLFWARNNQSVLKVLMDGPQNNIDLHLNNILDENYYRWQIWLENPIELDDVQTTTIDRLMDLAHGHLEEMEAYDNRHRLGRLIEDLQSSF